MGKKITSLFRAFRSSGKTVLAEGKPHGRFAVFGDVHSNLEALDAVLADARQEKIHQFICTGDIVGYGPDPSACLHRILSLGATLVQGNHDAYCATDCSLKEFSLNAMNALLWTRKQLKKSDREILNVLPLTQQVAGATVVHATLDAPKAWHYAIKPDQVRPLFGQDFPPLVFFGHTHVASIYSWEPASNAFQAEVPAREGLTPLLPDRKWLINPGSVGQSRDRDARASYLIYDPVSKTVEHRRVCYNLEKTARKIRAAGLPESNAARLSRGR